MRLDISIVVRVPSMTAEQRLEFIEGVLAIFRAGFPEAEPIYRPDVPPAVTVTFHEEELEEIEQSNKKFHIPTHKEITKGMEELLDDKPD